MMQDILWFGKHKGKHYQEVMHDYPSYALWAHTNVAGFCLSPSEIQSCIANSSYGLPRAARGNPHWMEDDDGPDEYGGMSYSDFGNN